MTKLGSPCLKYNSSEDIIFGRIYIFVLVSMYSLGAIILLKRRHTFPLKQRSPYVVCTAIFISTLFSIAFPLTFVLNPNNQYNPNTYINYLDANDDINMKKIMLIRSTYLALQPAFLLALLIRTVRIYIVFSTSWQNRLVYLLCNQEYGSVFCLLFFISVQLVSLSVISGSVCQSTSFFPYDLSHNCPQGNINTVYWFFTHTIFNFCMPLCCYFVRHVPKQFVVKQEIIITCIIYLTQIIQVPNACLSFMPIMHFLADMRNLLTLFIIVFYPLLTRKQDRFYYLPPSRFKNDVTIYLNDKELFNIFKKFLEIRTLQYQQNQVQYKKYENSGVFMSYLYKIRMIMQLHYKNKKTKEQKENQKKWVEKQLQKIIEDEILEKIHYFPQFIQEIFQQQDMVVEEVKKKTNRILTIFQQEQQQETIELKVIEASTIAMLFEICQEKIEQYFKEFQQTKSYHFAVKNLFARNDRINQRLFLFNMESIQQ